MTKSKLFLIFGVAALGLTLVYSVFAQTESAKRPSAPASVALVDIVHILSQNAAIDRDLGLLNDTYTKKIQAVEQEREKIKTLRDQLSRYTPESVQYRELETQMLSIANDIGAKQMLLVKEATEARMKVVRKAYETTCMHTKRVAEYFGMTVVLNYDRTPLPENIPGLLNSPQQYEAYMVSYSQFIASKTVVWADTGMVDLTPLVLKEIQKADSSTVKQEVAAAQPARPAGAIGTPAATPAAQPANQAPRRQ